MFNNVRCIALLAAAVAVAALPVPEVAPADSLAPTTFVRGYNPIVEGEVVQARGVVYPPMKGLPGATAELDDTGNDGVRYPPMAKRDAVADTVAEAIYDVAGDDDGVKYPPMCTPETREEALRRSVAGAPVRLHPMVVTTTAGALRRGVRYPPMECDPGSK